jgi:ATP-dependent DNA helicase RecQ
MPSIAFFDLEVDPKSRKVVDCGCFTDNGLQYHGASYNRLIESLQTCSFIAGHNIFSHDLPVLQQLFTNIDWNRWKQIDTLLLSPLLFPSKPYHRLVKDDKIADDAPNNPLSDSIKARDLFFEEITAFRQLEPDLQSIYFHLLSGDKRFNSFFQFINYKGDGDTYQLIRKAFGKEICNHAPVIEMIRSRPVELAYSLALIYARDRFSILPKWLIRTFPIVERILKLLRGTPCDQGCPYCMESLDARKALKRYFGYDSFRMYDGKPLQQKAVTTAIKNESLLAVFPTGGGKSITFQVPALISAESEKGLTIVISPLQSLMKDQVDNLLQKHISTAVTINGLLDPIERCKALEMVEDGSAGILYISPESLRSATIEKILLGRTISRFVIDEAHCFSSWGQDFRVDYLYIGEFIRNLQEKKNLRTPIPVSCFSATAKPQVIEDIMQYFKNRLGITLSLFQASVRRPNLHYKVVEVESEEGKFNELRNLLAMRNCPTIVYVSRTKKCEDLTEKLSQDGYEAKPFHGKMDSQEKTNNQNDFLKGETSIMVATSAFGMGVDKKDVGLVIHYDISDSLENYVQEAGRAGRDENLEADCYILYNNEDIDKHFIRLNQTRMNQVEINQVWKAVKDLTRRKSIVSHSALEIARKAGWDEGISDLETRVKTAIAALETSHYLKRKQNLPRVFATSIEVRNAEEAIRRIEQSTKILPAQKVNATRVVKALISSSKKVTEAQDGIESRVDYLADRLGISIYETIELINLLREEKILADAMEIHLGIEKDEVNKSIKKLNAHIQIEKELARRLSTQTGSYNIKELMEEIAEAVKIDVPIQYFLTILNYWVVCKWCKRQLLEYSRNHLQLNLCLEPDLVAERIDHRLNICRYILDRVEGDADFSILALRDGFNGAGSLYHRNANLQDIEDALLYLSRIGAVRVEGGFMVTYNKLQLERLEANNKVQYKLDDYAQLAQYYEQKVQQIHIVGEYAKKMTRNSEEAIHFTEDYFSLSYDQFVQKYFPGEKGKELKLKISPEKFKRIFGSLDTQQLEIIKDSSHRHIVVAAGPGSGKTRILVHKMASLLMMEDIKHEQLLMLTFSRSATLEFKKRLVELIGNAAHYIEIKTFHSFCFDLLGKLGNLEKSNEIIRLAVEKIRNGEIEPGRITKQVLVIDEAQDINDEEFELIKVLMEHNETMRTLIVGDDDQNIFSFRGANNRFMREMSRQEGARLYTLLTNYRSVPNIVSFSNQWVSLLSDRLKRDPIHSSVFENGAIVVTQYASNGILSCLATNFPDHLLDGTTAILTRTNEESFQLNTVLRRRGIPCRLIQGNEGFNLYNLIELHSFTDHLFSMSDGPTIPAEAWSRGLNLLRNDFGTSSKLDTCLALIDAYKVASPDTVYKSDWKSFLSEVDFADFISNGAETIHLSTMHKAKGREYENVYLLLDGVDPNSDDSKRLLYVAMTRAKRRLFVHYNGTYFDQINTANKSSLFIGNTFDPPDEVQLQLTHKDVQLGYFEYVERRTKSIVSGNKLAIMDDGALGFNNEKVLKFSSGFMTRIQDWNRKGYRLTDAEVNFVVYWTNASSGKASRIILPIVTLRKV